MKGSYCNDTDNGIGIIIVLINSSILNLNVRTNKLLVNDF